jgi:hypothetical protein
MCRTSREGGERAAMVLRCVQFLNVGRHEEDDRLMDWLGRFWPIWARLGLLFYFTHFLSISFIWEKIYV